MYSPWILGHCHHCVGLSITHPVVRLDGLQSSITLSLLCEICKSFAITFSAWPPMAVINSVWLFMSSILGSFAALIGVLCDAKFRLGLK